MTYMTRNAMRRLGGVALVVAAVSLSGCGSDKKQTEMPKLWGKLFKDVGGGVLAKVKGGSKSSGAAGAKGDPNAVVTAALAATDGPISLVVRETTAAISAMTPVETNGAYVTWQSSTKQSAVFRQGVLTATRGLGEDLMSAKPGASIAAIRGRQAAQYQRSYTHLGGLAETTELTVSCSLKPLKEEVVAIGEINTTALAMTESCKSPIGVKFKNIYWVADSGRIVKSRQWVSQPLGYLVIQPLR